MTAAPATETSTAVPRLPDPRTAIVTGAGGPAGIGRVTARLLAENGWHVALIDINADGLVGVEQELRDAGHQNVLALPTDIASESSVSETYERIDSELPQIVGLVNLAGIACPVRLDECSLAEFERVMAVNVTGSFLMLKAAAARMIPQGAHRGAQGVDVRWHSARPGWPADRNRRDGGVPALRRGRLHQRRNHPSRRGQAHALTHAP